MSTTFATRPARPRRSWFLALSFWGAVAAIIAAWWWIVASADRTSDLFSFETVRNVAAFVEKLLGAGEVHPAYRDPQRWRDVLGLALQTLAK